MSWPQSGFGTRPPRPDVRNGGRSLLALGNTFTASSRRSRWARPPSGEVHQPNLPPRRMVDAGSLLCDLLFVGYWFLLGYCFVRVPGCRINPIHGSPTPRGRLRFGANPTQTHGRALPSMKMRLFLNLLQGVPKIDPGDSPLLISVRFFWNSNFWCAGYVGPHKPVLWPSSNPKGGIMLFDPDRSILWRVCPNWRSFPKKTPGRWHVSVYVACFLECQRSC